MITLCWSSLYEARSECVDGDRDQTIRGDRRLEVVALLLCLDVRRRGEWLRPLRNLEVVIEAIAGREEPGLDPRPARPQRVRGVTRHLASSAWLVTAGYAHGQMLLFPMVKSPKSTFEIKYEGYFPHVIDAKK
jgi:hypothetical protein